MIINLRRGVYMNEVDSLVLEKLIPFREELLEVIKTKLPYVFGIAEKLFSDKENFWGLQVFDNGKLQGEYTFKTKGINVAHTESGKLEPLVKHPLVDKFLKPYIILEKNDLIAFLNDQSVKKQPIEKLIDFLPSLTIKFLK